MEEKIQTPEAIFIELSRLLDVEVKFEPEPNSQKVSPVIDVAAMLSKLMALMVYVGWNVPIHCMPPYNRVHADIEYWKKEFEPKIPAAAPELPLVPSEEPKPEPPPSEPPVDAGT